MKKKLSPPGRIKSRIILSYIIILLFVISFYSSIQVFMAIRMSTAQIDTSVDSIKDLAVVNSKLHEDSITPLSRQFLLLKGETIANELVSLVKKSNGYIKDDKDIRDLVTQDIMSDGRSVGYFALLDRKGDIIFHPSPDLEGKNISSLKEKYPRIYSFIENSFQKSQDSLTIFAAEDDIDSKQDSISDILIYIVTTHVPGTDYYVLSKLDVQKYLDPIFEKYRFEEGRELLELKKSISDRIRLEWIFGGLILITSLLLICGVCVLLGTILANRIANPIIALKEAVLKVGEGNLDLKVDETGSYETIELARNFNRMGEMLKRYIKDLEKEIHERQMIESEIGIAKKIQESVLPLIDKDFVRKEFQAAAGLVPAQGIAGDFYDLFYLDHDKTRLAMLIADVSGKGIPAAFFMGILKTVVNNVCVYVSPEDPARALEIANNFMCTNNRESMFGTMFLVYYDIGNGTFQYANGGHLPAIKISSVSKIDLFGELGDSLVGIYDGLKFKTGIDKLEPGESIVLITDGITEAFSPEGEFYGQERLLQIIADNSDKPPAELTGVIVDDAIRFENNVLFDDKTVLIFKREESSKG